MRIKAGQQGDPTRYQHLGDQAVSIVQGLTRENRTRSSTSKNDPNIDQTQDFETRTAPSIDRLAAERNDQAKDIPKQIGRYRVDGILGNGGFGLVYLAYDDQLDRRVAIKVPHARLVSQPAAAQAYLTEARTVANLEHAHIVPVYDVGQTGEFPCFVVSRYIEGTDLSERIKQQRLTYQEGVQLVATVAEALHYAHKQGLVRIRPRLVPSRILPNSIPTVGPSGSFPRGCVHSTLTMLISFWNCCRWLGKQMGLSEDQQAYASPDSLDKGEYPREPDPRANWAPRNWTVELGSQGFRLPTEAEWEVVARAGSRTVYGLGSDASLLGHFGWFVENSGKHIHPPRELLPSLHGLFDVHGSVYEWTHDWFGDYESKMVTGPLGPNRARSG